jgi:hypothetical protein
VCSLFLWLSSFVNSYSPSSVLCCCHTSCINIHLSVCFFVPLMIIFLFLIPIVLHQFIRLPSWIWSTACHFIWCCDSTFQHCWLTLKRRDKGLLCFLFYLAQNQFLSHLSFFIHLSSTFLPFRLKNALPLILPNFYYKDVTFLMKSYKFIIIEMRTERLMPNQSWAYLPSTECNKIA